MEYIFLSDAAFRSGQAGKLVLYSASSPENEIRLAASATDAFNSYVLSRIPDGLLLSSIIFDIGKDLHKTVGGHEDIPKTGRGLGGSLFAVRENRLLITGFSGTYGPINHESVRMCVETLGMEVVANNYHGINRKPSHQYVKTRSVIRI